MRAILHLVLSALAVLATAYLLPGVYIEGVGAALVTAIVLALVATALGPVLAVLTLPINLATMGLFTVVIMAVIVKLVDAMVPGLQVASFGWAVGFGLVFAAIDGALEGVLGRRRHALKR